MTRFVWLAPAEEAGEPGEHPKTSIVFWSTTDGNRDRVEIILPQPLSKKHYDAFHAAIHRAAGKAISALRRRRPKSK